MKARRNRVSGNNRRRGRWLMLGGARIRRQKEPERTGGGGGEAVFKGAVVVEMQTGKRREASEAGQRPIIMGPECLSETSLRWFFGGFAVAK